MTIARAQQRFVERPWGVGDVRPWSATVSNGKIIGEIWYELPIGIRMEPSLLMKLLFTSEALSIQVHPDDQHAQAMGLANGKTEAWYVLDAASNAQVGIGLKQQYSNNELRQAISDGTISDLVAWRNVATGRALLVPAGTIHAIGAGLVVAEIQQRSEATFRLFDYGRRRELHVDAGLAVANPGPAGEQADPMRLTSERTLLVSSPHFVFERIELPGETSWSLEVEPETWCLVVGGHGMLASLDVAKGDGIFVRADRVQLATDHVGMTLLLAYSGSSPIPNLLRKLEPESAAQSRRQNANRDQPWNVITRDSRGAKG